MDPFRILGLSADASLQEIKKAFHKMSLQCHPDKAGESSTLLFQHVNAAYELLKSGDFYPGTKSSTEAPRKSSDFDNYTAEELFEDLFRDFMEARDAQEQSRQQNSRREQSGNSFGGEQSSNRTEVPQDDDEGVECPICKQSPCKLFAPKKKPKEDGPAERIYRPTRQRKNRPPANSPGR